jgi:hypothetical protein
LALKLPFYPYPNWLPNHNPNLKTIFIVRACLPVGRGDEPVIKDFFENELLKIEGLIRRLMKSDGLTVGIKLDFFSDD